MAESIIYQLNCNQRHDKCFYIKLKKSKAHIIILGYNNRRYYLLRSLLASFHPISSGWVGENIFLLSESSLYILTIPSFTLVQVPLPAYKIIDILFFSFEKGYIYSSIIDPDYIDFYFKSNSISDIKIASYKISEKKTLFFKSSSLQFEPCIILNYLKEFKIAHEQNIYDIFNGHKLKIVHSELHSKISIDENCITTVFGCIDRGFFFGEKIIYTYSSLIQPSTVRMHIANVSTVRNSINNQSKKHIFSISYNDNNIASPFYHLSRLEKTKKGAIVMLHGGPAARYSNRFDQMAYSLANAGYSIHLLNYPGSTGYGYAYQKKLYGNAGTFDCNAVISYLNSLSQKDASLPLYLIGDSYGAFLAILVLLKASKNISKVYALNAFTDIRYQFLFSNARAVITKYFPEITSTKIRQINPIDLVAKGQLKDCLLIINGLDDLYCPKEQLIQFQSISGCDVILMPNYPHYKIDPAETDKITRIILEDMRGKRE